LDVIRLKEELKSLIDYGLSGIDIDTIISKFRIIDKMELMQYSVGHLYDKEGNYHPDLQNDKRLRDVLTFFRDAQRHDSIPEDIDAELRRAYQLISIEHLTKKHPEILENME